MDVTLQCGKHKTAWATDWCVFEENDREEDHAAQMYPQKFILLWANQDYTNALEERRWEKRGKRTYSHILVDLGSSPEAIRVHDESGCDAALEEQFKRLAKEWRSQTGPISSTSQMVMIPAYQRIMAMGPKVVPLILRELQKEPDYWFWALEMLTGESPVPDNDRGNIRRMTAAWLDWGKRKGYLRNAV